MQYINGIIELSDVNHSKRAGAISDSNLADTGTNRGHRLPVEGTQPMLYPIKLKTRLPPSTRRKFSQAIQRIAAEFDGFHVVVSI